MAYVRAARKEEVVKWLLDNGHVKGQAKAEALAEALVEKFDMIMVSNTQ